MVDISSQVVWLVQFSVNRLIRMYIHISKHASVTPYSHPELLSYFARLLGLPCRTYESVVLVLFYIRTYSKSDSAGLECGHSEEEILEYMDFFFICVYPMSDNRGKPCTQAGDLWFIVGMRFTRPRISDEVYKPVDFFFFASVQCATPTMQVVCGYSEEEFHELMDFFLFAFICVGITPIDFVFFASVPKHPHTTLCRWFVGTARRRSTNSWTSFYLHLFCGLQWGRDLQANRFLILRICFMSLKTPHTTHAGGLWV